LLYINIAFKAKRVAGNKAKMKWLPLKLQLLLKINKR
jgi:hypothetical protein